MKKVEIEFGGVVLEALYTDDQLNADGIELHGIGAGGVNILPALMRAAAVGSGGVRDATRWQVWLLDGLCEQVSEAAA